VLEITDAELMTWLGAWLWPFIRISTFVVTAPVIGTQALPRRVRLIFALALTTIIAPLHVAAMPHVEIMSAAGLGLAVQQVLIGGMLGLVLRTIFLILEFAGQIVAQQMGLGFAAMVDPVSGAQVPVVSQLYIILATLMFFAFNAHLKLIELISDSFTLMPPGGNMPSSAALSYIIDWTGQMLGAGMLMMMPAVASLLIVNLSFGVIARSAPQFNIFSIGFPVMILFGAVVMLLSIGMLAGQMEQIFADGFAAAYETLRRQ
jgi:flagellar biosynthetic protein FliR